MQRGARIIVIPHDRNATREFNISGRLIMALVVLIFLVGLLMLAIIMTYGGLMAGSRRIPRLEAELSETRAQLVRVQELEVELQDMRGFRLQVLTMLGAQGGRTPADQMDTFKGGRISNIDSISTPLLFTPPPDRWPVRGFVTNEFRAGNTAGGNPPHLGFDIVAPVGTPIVAAGAGLIRQAGWDEYLGNFVEISHGFGYVTTYGHCASVDVGRGDRVESGARIAALGGSGQVSAPHLHFEIWRDGQSIDPRLVISGDPDYTD